MQTFEELPVQYLVAAEICSWLWSMLGLAAEAKQTSGELPVQSVSDSCYSLFLALGFMWV